MSENQTKELPCLGRPIYPGMLYDCRSDNVVPGVTLWDEETIKKSLNKRHDPKNSISIITEDSVQSKTSSLNVEAGLSLSALGGLVKVSGSAKFMNNKKTSTKDARVTMHYSMTSHFEQMTMETLAKFQYGNVIDKHVATHVVTGVTYGVQAFFIFDHEVSENESEQEISGKLQIAVNKIPDVSIEGHGSLDMKGVDKGTTDKMKCTFVGDVNLETLPTTFESAVKVYQNLPKQIFAGTNPGEFPVNVVPLKVWLYPLSKLDSKAAKLVREISNELVNEAQALIEDLHVMKTIATDLQKGKVCSYFSGIKEQLGVFIQMVSVHTMNVMKDIVALLPDIRGGGKTEEDLASVIKQHYESPFSHSSLSSWLEEKTQEIDILETYVSGLSGSQSIQFALSPGELHKITLQLDVDNVLCLMFTIPQNNDTLGTLKKMATYNHMTNQDHFKPPSNLPWYQDENLISNMRNTARDFKSLAEATDTASESIKFVVSQKEPNKDKKDKDKECEAEIILYHDGKSSSFKVPNKPATPTNVTCVTQYDSIQLKWSDSPGGGASYTMILYQALGKKQKAKKTDDNKKESETEAGDDPKGWKKKLLRPADSKSTTLTGLKPDTTYRFKIRVRYEMGFSLDSDMIDPVVTKKDVIKLRLLLAKDKGKYESGAGVYSRTEEKWLGRYVWKSDDKKFVMYYDEHDYNSWVIDTQGSDFIKDRDSGWGIGFSKDGSDVPYEADWTTIESEHNDYKVSEVMLAVDQQWRPLKDLWSD